MQKYYISMKNRKTAGRKILEETRGRGYRGMRRSTAESVGRCSKKPRTSAGTGVASPNPEMLGLTSRGENAPPLLDFPDPQAAKPWTLDAWSPNSSTSMDFMMGFMDEEEMFNMPGLVNSMAEGMLLTPPAMKRGFRWSHDIDDQVDDANYIHLWGE